MIFFFKEKLFKKLPIIYESLSNSQRINKQEFQTKKQKSFEFKVQVEQQLTEWKVKSNRLCYIYIDLKPALDYEQLDARILRDFSENTNKNYINSLGALLPRKLIPVVAKLSGIKPTAKVNQITREERRRLVELLKSFKVTVKGFRPIDEAIITSGGVRVSEINPKTMESKLLKGLYFAGEVIDVDAYTGGFNLQIAFSTGKLAGENI